MKKILSLSVLILALMFAASTDSYGQYYSKKKKKKKKTKTEKNDEYFDESGGFGHKLWYGGGVNLGFSGNGLTSLFQIGVSPMVGYKIIEPFSVGPRASIQYNLYRINDGGGVLRSSYATWSLGAFTRFKVFQNFFAHGEFEFENGISGFSLNGNDLVPIRQNRENFYIGAGYNSSAGGLLGYEIYLLYNLNQVNLDISESPIEIRFGITYKF